MLVLADYSTSSIVFSTFAAPQQKVPGDMLDT